MAQVLSQSALDEWTTNDTEKKYSATTARPTTARKVVPIPTKLGVWDLQINELNEFQPPENTESLFNGPAGESVIGADGRKKVAKKDLLPGGKYRGMFNHLGYRPKL